MNEPVLTFTTEELSYISNCLSGIGVSHRPKGSIVGNVKDSEPPPIDSGISLPKLWTKLEALKDDQAAFLWNVIRSHDDVVISKRVKKQILVAAKRFLTDGKETKLDLSSVDRCGPCNALEWLIFFDEPLDLSPDILTHHYGTINRAMNHVRAVNPNKSKWWDDFIVKVGHAKLKKVR